MERLDLYKDRFVKTGDDIVRKTAIPQGTYGLIIFVCIFNSKGEMLIQQRSMLKRGWPGLWDVSVGGGVMSGESSLEAAMRETKEELGIEFAPEQFIKVMSVYYDAQIHDMYVLNADVDLEECKIQEEEVQRIMWASEEKINEMIEGHSFIAVHKEFIGLMFRMKEKKGILQ